MLRLFNIFIKFLVFGVLKVKLLIVIKLLFKIFCERIDFKVKCIIFLGNL